MKLLKLSDKFKSGKYEGKTPSVVINKGQSRYLKFFLSRNKDVRLHKDVIKHAQSKTQLKMNKTMVETLEEINSKVSKKLLYLNKRKRIVSTFTNVKAYKTKKDTITFDIPFGNKKNQIKVGRFVKKVFELNGIEEFSERDIEVFVNDYYSKVGEPKLKGAYFEVVTGEKVRECYLEDNYHKRTGTLIRSCARYYHYQGRIDFYVYNPNEISMLVLFDKETKKVRGRALIWNDSKILFNDGTVFEGSFMDRIYTNNDKDIALFKSWAKKKGMVHKFRQSYDCKEEFVTPNENRKTGLLISKIDESNYQRPYFDTMIDGAFLLNNNGDLFISNSYEYDRPRATELANR